MGERNYEKKQEEKRCYKVMAIIQLEQQGPISTTLRAG